MFEIAKYSLTSLVYANSCTKIVGVDTKIMQNILSCPNILNVIHEKTNAGVKANLLEKQNDGLLRNTGNCAARLYSIEVCNIEIGKNVAGELGYSVGIIYMRLTGFLAQDSSGSVHLAALDAL